MKWMKSSYSNQDPGGECIEYRRVAEAAIEVRDSKNPSGPRLTLTREGFAGLVALAKSHG
ncbi:DUF397 domain-containing protein [Streptomyces sp. NPDC057555]|uniref:DUF397 domain-containing protein n=1 Tax=Streptomyces sp. NPDC057555 TaxID=3346166 RepID=UPI0036BA1BBB